MNRLFLLLFVIVSVSGFTSTDASLKEICEVQGTGFSSPLLGRNVIIRGIVTADFDLTYVRGFYLQDPNCDTKSTTSDGIFVYIAERIDLVKAGDLVQVEGLVQEYYGMTEIKAALEDIIILSHANPLPIAKELSPPFSNSSADYYFETLEGMLVSISAGRVVGPTDSDDRTWLVRAELGIQHVFYDDPEGNGEVICVDDGGLFELSPEASVGDQAVSLLGVLDFRYGAYCMELISEPNIEPGIDNHNEGFTLLTGDERIRVATFNLAELFDTLDDPLTQDQVLSWTEYQRKLEKRALAISQVLQYPAVLALQEVENPEVLRALVMRPEIQAGYEYLMEEGPDVRGLDVALLYRPDLVSVISSQSYQGCTTLVDGFEPDGNGDPLDPVNELTCDRDGDGTLDGNRLFSRPPLVANLWIRPEENPGIAVESKQVMSYFDFWLVVTHFKSKVGDGYVTAYTLPRRIEQAQFVAGLVDDIRQTHPGAQLLVLGDFNDYPDSQPLSILTANGLFSSARLQERSRRYTYIYQGISQTLDDILYFPNQELAPAAVNALHINADYPYADSFIAGTPIRSSDHDPLVVDLISVFPTAYLPLIAR